MACRDLLLRRRLVHPAFAAGLPLEMLDRVGDVDSAAIDAGLHHRLIEHASRRTDKGASCFVLLVSRLLADDHDHAVGAAFAENGLRRMGPERAGATVCGFLTQMLDGGS